MVQTSFGPLYGMNGSLIFMCIIALVFIGFFCFFSLQKKNKSAFDWIVIVLFIFTFLFTLLLVSTVYFPIGILVALNGNLIAIMFPTLWILGGLGIATYGTAAVITGKTYANLPLPIEVNGVGARYLGILWVLCGLVLVSLGLSFTFSMFCTYSNKLCQLVEPILGFMTGTVDFVGIIAKPLKLLDFIH